MSASTVPRARPLPVRTSASQGSAMSANWSPRLEIEEQRPFLLVARP
ncbi:MAG TPA: hypothetical protein VIK08_08935 [Candidatus Limnocylindrales bacterium]